MNSRVFGRVLSQRLHYNSIVRGYSVQTGIQNYAIMRPKGCAFVPFIATNNTTRALMKDTFDPNFCKKFLTTQIAHKELSQNVDYWLTSTIAHYTNTGYVQYEHFQKLIGGLENGDYEYDFLTKENIQFLLHACGTQMPTQTIEARMELFDRLWTLLRERNLLTKDAFLQKLQILQHNQLPLDNLESFLNEMKTVTPTNQDAFETPELYSEILRVACSNGSMRNAMDVLTAMRDRNFALTEENFNALIMGHGRNHDLNGIQTTVDSMRAAGVALSNETQTTIFVAFIENNEHAKALEILQKFHGQFSAEQILRMLRSGLNFELGDEIIRLLARELPAEYTSGPDLSFGMRQLCNELIHNGKFELVKSIIDALPMPIFSENQCVDTYATSILTELFRSKVSQEEIIKFAETLIASKKNTRALHVVTEIAMHRSPPSALVFLDSLSQMEPLRPHYFWPLIMYNFRRHGESGILTTLRHMKRMKVSCDNETLLFYVLPHMAITLENPVQCVKMLIDAGVKSSLLLTPVLRHLFGQQKIAESIQLIELYNVKLDLIEQLLPVLQQLSVNVRATRRYAQFAKLLKELSNRNEHSKIDFVGQLLINMLNKQERLQQDLKLFQRFISEMEKIGLRISARAITILESILQKLADTDEAQKNNDIHKAIMKTLQQMKDRELNLPQNPNDAGGAGAGAGVGGANSSSTFIKHPRDMSLTELECHLIELESKGMNARGVLRRLLQLYVRENCLDRALEIKAKCDKLRVQESPGMLASIFDMYIKLGDLKKSEETLEKLQKTYPGFHLDEHKFIDYAALLIRENQFERSLQLLSQRSANERINGGDYVIKNVWNFLTNIAQIAAQIEPKLSAEQNLTRDAFEFVQKLGYCKAHNAVLGPIVREYLLRGDIKSAIGEFKRLAEKYKHTPLQFELLSILVRLSNGVEEEVERFLITSEEAQKLLNDVIQIVSKVHGQVNMNSTLVLAFAESGTDNQLRRLLIDPEFRINQELLQKNCDHLGKEGAVRTLLRLAKGARGLNRSIDEQTLYNMLLNNFVKTNDCNAALELFERLDADNDLKISTDFVKNLVNLLKANKMDVPSNVELKAYINRVKI